MANALIQVAPVPSIAKARQNALTARGMETRNALLRQQAQDYPEERAWTREKREMEREDFEWQQHVREFKTSLEPLAKLQALDKMMRLVSNKTTLSNHDAVTANISRQLGIDPSQAQGEISAAQIAEQAQAAGQDPETYYQQVYKPQSLMTWEQQFELMKEQIKQEGKETPEEKEATAKRLIDYRAATPPKPTLSEREMMRQKGAVGKLQSMAEKDPNKPYEHGYKMNEDRSLYLDPVTEAPVKLPPFHKVMGKRGQIKAMKQLGENWDDAKQLMELLKDSEVAKNLKTAEKEIGFWDRVSGKWNNKIQLWMHKRGISKDSPTGTAITRMQRLASQERKEFLGVAVTGTELESTLAWMPNAGDSLSTMLNKVQLMVQEGSETFRRYLDIYKDVANMTPFYKAFGLKRFTKEKQSKQTLKTPKPQQQIKKPVDEADAYLKSIGQ